MSETVTVGEITIEYESSNYYKCGSSEYIIDNSHNLWVKGDNKYGKLGANSDSETIDDWTLISDPDELVKNVSVLKIDSSLTSKDFVVLCTLDDKYYFAGKFGSTNYTKFTDEKVVLKEKINPLNKSKKSKVYKTYTTFKNNSYYPIFKFKKRNNFYAFDLTAVTQKSTFKVLLSGNDQYHNIYTDFAVTPAEKVIIGISDVDTDGYQTCWLFVNDESEKLIEPNEDYKYIFTSLELTDIHSDEIIFYEYEDTKDGEITFSYENPVSSIEYSVDDNGYFGSNNETYATVEIPNNSTNPKKYTMINLNVDINNTKAIIEDTSLQDGDYENKDIIPFEDSTYKGPQFLYPIFYNMGIPFNKFCRFEGIIIVDGYQYPVTAVKISNPIEGTTKYGVIQFLLSKDAKLYNNEAKKSYYEEGEEGNGNIFGITFYPIIQDEKTGAYSYKVLDNIENSIVSQNNEMNCVYTNYVPKLLNTSDSFLNRICHDGNYLYICDKEGIGILNTKTCRIEKHVTFESLGSTSQFLYINNYTDETNYPDEDLLIAINNENKGFIINKEVMIAVSSIDINDITTYTNKDNVEENDEVTSTSVKHYRIQDNEYCFEIKFSDDDNYYIFKIKSDSDYASFFTYRDHMVNNSNMNRTTDVDIIPSVVQGIDGIVFIVDDEIREGFPKEAEIEY